MCYSFLGAWHRASLAFYCFLFNKLAHSILAACMCCSYADCAIGMMAWASLTAGLIVVLGGEALSALALLHTYSTALTLWLLHSDNRWLLQLWLVALIGMMARASPTARLMVAVGVAALSALALPSNLWRPQLKRLGTLALLIFIFTAIGAGALLSFSQHHCACV